jgi:hypothetical protein
LALEREVTIEYKLIPMPVATADILNLKLLVAFIPLHLATGAALGRDRCRKLGSLGLSDGMIRLPRKRDHRQKGGGSKKRPHRSVLQTCRNTITLPDGNVRDPSDRRNLTAISGRRSPR